MMKKFNLLILTLCFLTFISATGCSLFESKEEKFKKLQTQAYEYLKENKLEEARISLRSALKIQPSHAELNYQLAEVMIKLKKFKQGVTYYRQALEFEPDHRKANLHIAAIYLVASNLDKVEDHVNKVLAQDENDEDALAILANLYSKKKNFEEADKILDRILEISPDNVTALAGKADVSLASRDFSSAEKYLKKAYETNPKSSPIQLALIDFYVKLGREQEAEELLSNLVTENPNNPTLRYYYGEYLLTKGSPDEAIEQFEQTLSKKPENFQVRDRLFDLYVFNNKEDKAKELLQKLESNNPKDPSINYFRGRVAELSKENEKSAEFYRAATSELRHFAPAFRRAGIAELRYGNDTQGLEFLDTAVVLNEFDVGARLALAQYYFKLKNYANASANIKKVLEKFPNQTGANTLKADIALLEGDLKTAEKIYLAIIKNYPDSPTGYIKMGLLSEKKGQIETAVSNYETALSKDIGVWTPLKRFVPLSIKKSGVEQTKSILQSYLNSSNKSKAQYNVALAQLGFAGAKSKEDIIPKTDMIYGHLNTALAENPDFLPTYSILARVDSITGNTSSSIKNYKTLVEKKPKDKSYRLLLAMNLEKNENYEEAISEYQKVLEVDSRFAPAANNLAWLLSEKGMKEGENSPLQDEALRLAQIAKEEMPNQSAVTDTLGWIYYRKGSFRLALATLEEAISIDEKAGNKVNPEIVLHLAKVYDALEDKDSALKAYKRALEDGGLSEIENSHIKSQIARYSK